MNRFTVPLLLACAAAACGTDPYSPELERALNPICSAPAPLVGRPEPKLPDAYLVELEQGVDPEATARALALEHGFEVRSVYRTVLSGFSAVINSVALAHVRCEPSVKAVYYDQLFSVRD